MLKKAIILTNGCPENRIDSAKIEMLLKANNWEITEKLPDADLVLFNTCGITEFSQNKSIEFIIQIKQRKKSDAIFGVCGCLPKINNKLLREYYQGPVLDSDDLNSIINFINVSINERDIHANYLIPVYDFPKIYDRIIYHFKYGIFSRDILKFYLVFPYRKILKDKDLFNKDTFSIKISTGCLSSCSFCAVKLSRGHLRSREIKDIVEEFKIGLMQGFNKFVLIGTDTGAYGRDIGVNLALLLQELLKIKGEFKIALRNLNPKYFKILLPDLKDVLKSDKISDIGIPVESGSNHILKSMKRGYTIEDFIEIILFLNRKYPKIKLHTQLLVGFPGETDEDFNDSINLMKTLEFDFIEIYLYSIRPDTIANQLENKVPNRIAVKRYHHLLYKFLMYKLMQRFNLKGRLN